MQVKTQYLFRNWSRVFSSRPQQFVQPDSEQELIALVQDAVANQKRIRVVGAGHSWSAIALTDQVMINLDHYHQVLHLDKEKRQVTVQAGMRLKDLISYLEKHDMALSNLGSIAEQSVAGAISTGTHGTGIEHGILATQVIGMRLITGTGEVLDLDESSGDLWRAALVSLGCLGIISTVTLQCVKAFHLEEQAWPLPFDTAIEQLPQLIRGNDHLKLWWFPHAPNLQVYTYNQTDQPIHDPQSIQRAVDDHFLATQFFTLLLWLGIQAPKLTPRINAFINILKFKKDYRVDKSHKILNVPMPPRHREAEYAIPVEHTGKALLEIKQMIEDEGMFINFVLEVRFTKADNILLSPTYGRDSCYLGAYKAGNKGWMEYMQSFEAIIKKYQGRPHWGKETAFSKAEVQTQYPEMSTFQSIRKELDPHGIFINEYINEMIR